MNFLIKTRYTPSACHASCEGLKATCTAGEEWAAKAVITKIINRLTSAGEMKLPRVISLEQTSGCKEWNVPKEWLAVIAESTFHAKEAA